ncbi:DUF4926 domain-containing protein [uncultured Tateyamaria sp.]|uniref:DUF4926 domain-containing protein n=1 Tax=uncultured Tateyamaria sp. TaxID=455651 RepID=UPI002614BDD7|nr:DUF4926 domain-containing protein [uncultured Tateyamaria sp.]
MKELDVVSLRESRVPLKAGSIGTIVHENTPGKSFMVEFCDASGRTIALEDLSVDDVDLVQAC